MPTIIYTGDDQKCRTFTYAECPACSEMFESDKGIFSHSATLDSDILVCKKHADCLTITEELCVQNSLQKALGHSRGRVQRDGKLLKKSDILVRAELFEEKLKKGL